MGNEYEAKRCKSCKEIHPLTNFNKTKQVSSGLMAICRPCYNKKIRGKYDPLKKKAKHLKALYGITLEEFYSKIEEQDNKCAICKTDTPTGNGTHFYVDHNHETGQVRDLLCHNCNFVIGHSKENKEVLLAAVQYLAKWEALQSPRS